MVLFLFVFFGCVGFLLLSSALYTLLDCFGTSVNVIQLIVQLFENGAASLLSPLPIIQPFSPERCDYFVLLSINDVRPLQSFSSLCFGLSDCSFWSATSLALSSAVFNKKRSAGFFLQSSSK